MSTRKDLFKDYLLDILNNTNSGRYVSLSSYSENIAFMMEKIPKKKNSSEWYYLYLSVLNSFYQTLLCYGSKVLELDEFIIPKVTLIGISKEYNLYVECIVKSLLGKLRDSFLYLTSRREDNLNYLYFRKYLVEE